jgi:ligand-binding sensor domain-containing protein
MENSARFVHYHHDPARSGIITPGSVEGISEDAIGKLWVVTDYGIDYLDCPRGTFSSYYRDTSQAFPGRITRLATDRSGGVWFAMVSMLGHIDPPTRRVVWHTSPTAISAIACGAKGRSGLVHRMGFACSNRLPA